MATIYQNSAGASVYDYNGQTIDAHTGLPYVAPTSTTTPKTATAPVVAPAPAPAPAPTSAPMLPGLGGGGYTNPTPIDYSKLQLAPTTTAAPAPTGGTTNTTYAKSASYTGPSIVDFLSLSGQPTDFMSRTKLAAQYGITNYTGTADQNTQLLQKLRSLATTPTTQSAATPMPTVGSGGALASNVASALPSTIPSTALTGTMSSSDLLSKASGVYDQYKGYQDQLLAASQPSAQEQEASAQIRDLNTKLAQGIAKINSQAIPEPLIGLQGQKLQEQIASVIKPLQDELTGLIEQRSTRVDAITRVMQATPEMIQMLGNIQKLTMPNVLGTQVNQQTGDIYSITQGSDGQLQLTNVGNIGSNNTGKTYVQSGTYQAGDGTQYFFGVKPDGTVDNVQLQGAAGTPSHYGTNATGGGGGGGGTATFSTTQINKGAANAGLTIENFSQLDPNTQNWFINAYSGYKTSLNGMTKEQAASKVQSDTSLSDGVKKLMLSLLGVSSASAGTTAAPSSGGGFWSTAGNLFSSAAGAVFNWLTK